MGIAAVIGVFVVGIAIWACSRITIVPQSHLYVVEKMGRFEQVWEAGMHFRAPFESVRNKVPKFEMNFDAPPQPVITKDNVTITADSFMFFTIFDANLYTYGVGDVRSSLNALCISTLRDIIGKMDLEQCLSSRDAISKQMTSALDQATDKWGIKVTRVEIKTFTPPRNIMEAMERQMKADREKREQIIRAEADKEAAILSAQKEKEVRMLSAQAARDAADLQAEATRIATVKKAEAEKEAAILRADAAKEVRIREAEAQAESIRIVQQATAEGIRAINASAPSEATLRLKAYEAFATAANGQSTKIIIPSDMQGLVGMATALKDTVMSSSKTPQIHNAAK